MNLTKGKVEEFLESGHINGDKIEQQYRNNDKEEYRQSLIEVIKIMYGKERVPSDLQNTTKWSKILKNNNNSISSSLKSLNFNNDEANHIWSVNAANLMTKYLSTKGISNFPGIVLPPKIAGDEEAVELLLNSLSKQITNPEFIKILSEKKDIDIFIENGDWESLTNFVQVYNSNGKSLEAVRSFAEERVAESQAKTTQVYNNLFSKNMEAIKNDPAFQSRQTVMQIKD